MLLTSKSFAFSCGKDETVNVNRAWALMLSGVASHLDNLIRYLHYTHTFHWGENSELRISKHTFYKSFSCEKQFNKFIKRYNSATSLVVWWLRICLAMQGTPVQFLAREDPTCSGATKPECHKYWSLHTQGPCWATEEAIAMRSLQTVTREWPLLPATRESPRTATKTQYHRKINQELLHRVRD